MSEALLLGTPGIRFWQVQLALSDVEVETRGEVRLLGRRRLLFVERVIPGLENEIEQRPQPILLVGRLDVGGVGPPRVTLARVSHDGLEGVGDIGEILDLGVVVGRVGTKRELLGLGAHKALVLGQTEKGVLVPRLRE